MDSEVLQEDASEERPGLETKSVAVKNPYLFVMEGKSKVDTELLGTRMITETKT